MSEDSNAVLALQNAWVGAVTESKAVDALATSVAALPADTLVAALDLDQYHERVLAQSIAVMALRGVIEQLKRKSAAESEGRG